MIDLNPISGWKRLLALPNESRTKTIVVAFLLSAACAVLVTTATVYLRPIQIQNRAAEEQLRLDKLLASIPGMSEIVAEAGGSALSSVVVDLTKGSVAEGQTSQTVQAALDDPSNWTQLAPEQDTADIGARPDIAQIFILRDQDRIALLLLPIIGSGYNGPIRAMLALRGDMNTIAGLTITDQAETPGLGARIEEAEWQALFAGKQIADDKGTLRFSVARGPANTEYEVDGITGATRTSNAITRMVRFWVGPDGYGPLIDAVRRGEF
ncbi:NADH:ubiquinone reductase (Na(+)-transporting) subunit C [Aliiroseovarius sp. S1339]|uniref:NADH:ubiquinone reductase (Na(+)-transporting) subunit C n=1 Tax=Aliiroseovarius sp. S1339 TaxID=2936990 RepID=UPI0020BF814B|nr:NADH:ubiquinone reductase (Na(+)-transporting) subunit C [Aliiroseovarius sp. S1339]MCK8462482.1 NADH:ubiquinone reductase (Na(+)-transporting) subunit C [Aliiroseovarius sp. S1339]